MSELEKLLKAKELILEVEAKMADNGLCPYEIAYTLKNLDDAISFLKINFPQ